MCRTCSVVCCGLSAGNDSQSVLGADLGSNFAHLAGCFYASPGYCVRREEGRTEKAG